MSRFGSIKTERTPPVEPAQTEGSEIAAPTSPRPPGRQGKKTVSGYFSPDVSLGLHLLALELGVSLQALMGEAFDDLMRKYGKHPFGER